MSLFQKSSRLHHPFASVSSFFHLPRQTLASSFPASFQAFGLGLVLHPWFLLFCDLHLPGLSVSWILLLSAHRWLLWAFLPLTLQRAIVDSSTSDLVIQLCPSQAKQVTSFSQLHSDSSQHTSNSLVNINA